MAQPTGQVALASGHTSEYFFYAQGTNGIWDAKNGALLTKTGSAGMAVENSANVVIGDNATYYSLSSAISFTGSQAYTIIVKCRTSAGDNKAMPFGDRASTSSFFWINNGSGSGIYRSIGDSSFTNSSPNTMAVYAFVYNGSSNLRILKNNSEVYNGTASGTFTLNAILDGYSSGAYALTGALEYLHVIPSALDSATLTSYYSDPYQVLASSGGADATATGTPDTLDLIAPTASASGTGGANGSASGSPSPASITAPAATATGTTAGSGIITTPALKNNTGTILASISGWTVNVYNVSTGALVVQKTGLTTSAGGVLTVTDAAITTGTTYAYEPVHATYGRRLPTGAAS